MTNNLPIKTLEDIRDLNPCYDPSRYLPETWAGTALDILRMDAAPPKDRLWVVLHAGWIPVAIMVSFARWCADDANAYANVYVSASAYAAEAARVARADAHAAAAKAVKAAAYAAAAYAYAAEAYAARAAYAEAAAIAAAREKQVATLIRLLEGLQ